MTGLVTYHPHALQTPPRLTQRIYLAHCKYGPIGMHPALRSSTCRTCIHVAGYKFRNHPKKKYLETATLPYWGSELRVAVLHGKFAEHRRYTDLAHINENKNGRSQASWMGPRVIRFVAVPRLIYSSLGLTGLKTSGIREWLLCVSRVNLVTSQNQTQRCCPLSNQIGVPLGPGLTWSSSHGPKRWNRGLLNGILVTLTFMCSPMALPLLKPGKKSNF